MSLGLSHGGWGAATSRLCLPFPQPGPAILTTTGLAQSLRLGRDTPSRFASADSGPAEEAGPESEMVTGQPLSSVTCAGALSPGLGRDTEATWATGALACSPAPPPWRPARGSPAQPPLPPSSHPLQGQGWCPQWPRSGLGAAEAPVGGGGDRPPRLTATLSAGHLSCGWRGRWLYGRFR